MRALLVGGLLAAGLAGLGLAGLGLASPSWAQTQDVFAFIPAGGRTLLAEVLGSRPSGDTTQVLLGGKHTRDAWLEELRQRAATVPTLKRLDDTQLATLADYLAYNMPLPSGKMPADTAKADWAHLLPPDGRDLALDYCQSCHIITVVITQDRSREAWLGTMHKPSHIQIKLTEAQREALANYLVLNAAIPIDQVPPDLRAGGATY